MAIICKFSIRVISVFIKEIILMLLALVLLLVKSKQQNLSNPLSPTLSLSFAASFRLHFSNRIINYKATQQNTSPTLTAKQENRRLQKLQAPAEGAEREGRSGMQRRTGESMVRRNFQKEREINTGIFI